MEKKQKPDRIKIIREVLEKARARLTSRLLRDDRQTYNQMMAELARNGEPASTEASKSKGKCPDCCQRRPAPSDTEYSMMNGSKRKVEGRRSIDLNAPRSPTVEEISELRRVAEIVHIADTSLDADLDLVQEAPDAYPKCARRTATPTADEYSTVRTNNKAVEGRRSIDLDPKSSQTPEEHLIQKEADSK